MTPSPTWGLVVVGFDSDDVWSQFFTSLRASTLTPSSIVVVENSPTVPNLDQVIGSLPVQVLHLRDNPGYGTASNRGVDALADACEFVVICNPDTILTPDAIPTLLSIISSRDDVALVGPKILTKTGDVYPSARAFPGIRIGIGHAFFGRLWPTNPWSMRYLGDYVTEDERVVGWVSGSFFVARTHAFRDVKGFDEGYFMFFEDVDLAFRLKQHGWRTLYVPHAVVTHSGAHSTGKNMARMVREHHRSAERFLAKLYPQPHHAPLRALLRLGLRARAVFVTKGFS